MAGGDGHLKFRMKNPRQRLLVASVSLAAAVSVGLNVWLFMDRQEGKTAEGMAPPAPEATVEKEAAILQPVTMDFSGTAFADGSWKLTDETPPAFDLDKPFNWEQVTPEGAPPPAAPEKESQPGTRTAQWDAGAGWKPSRPVEQKLSLAPPGGFSTTPERTEVPGLDGAIVSEARHPRSKHLLAPLPLK